MFIESTNMLHLTSGNRRHVVWTRHAGCLVLICQWDLDLESRYCFLPCDERGKDILWARAGILFLPTEWSALVSLSSSY